MALNEIEVPTPQRDALMSESAQPSQFRIAIRAVLLIGLLVGFGTTEFFEVAIESSSLKLNADIAAFLLRLLGEGAQATGTTISSSRFVVQIGSGCDALLPYLLFSAAVVASPVTRMGRLVGVVGGGIALLVLNQIRIVTLYYTGILYPGAFQTMHRDVWQVLFIAIGVGLWVGWALWVPRLKSRPIPA